MHYFNKLKLPPMLEKALAEMNLETLTSLQAKAIPVALAHRDIIGCAQTGIAKTVAFCLPVIARLIKVPQKTALILVPTHELGIQVLEILKKLTHHYPEIRSALVVGGMEMQSQIHDLQGRPSVVVATPDRLVDHLKRGSVSLSSTEVLVLDKADCMLDLGFAPQLNEILRFLPKTRQTLFFSATLTANIEKLSTRFLKDPVRMTVEPVSSAVQKVINYDLPQLHKDYIHQIGQTTKTAKKNQTVSLLTSEDRPHWNEASR